MSWLATSQARVMASHEGADGPSTVLNQTNKIQTNVIKTMILVCVFYAIAWLPDCIYFLLMSLQLNLTFHTTGQLDN